MRKTPIRHKVRQHTREGYRVREHMRGQSKRPIIRRRRISKEDKQLLFKRQLKIGIKVEMEHTNNPKIAEKIARDHLREFPDYYTRLLKMEAKAKKELSNPENYIKKTKGYRLQNGKLQLYVATDKTTNFISTRNRKIMTILRAEEATSSRELARRLDLRESTILVELKYLEKEGFVRKVK